MSNLEVNSSADFWAIKAQTQGLRSDSDDIMLWKDRCETVICSLAIHDSWKSIISAFSAAVSRQDYITLVNLLQLCYRTVIVSETDVVALFICWFAVI